MRTSIKRVSAALLLACGACQAYSTIDPSAAPTGTPVRVSLTDNGSLALGNQLGATARTLEGTVQSVSDSSITLSVTQITRLSGAEDAWKGERVTIPRANVSNVERRSTSVGRSVVLGALLLGGSMPQARARKRPGDRGIEGNSASTQWSVIEPDKLRFGSGPKARTLRSSYQTPMVERLRSDSSVSVMTFPVRIEIVGLT